MEKSDSITALCKALAKAQAKITGAVKDKTNPHFKSSYATLESVVDAIRPVAAENGLSFVQISRDSDNCAAVETVILHESGEWVSCGVVSVPVSKGDAQGFGSAFTYSRRYSLSAAFGVAPEDDDGNGAAKAKPEAVETKTIPQPQLADILASITETASLDDLKTAYTRAVGIAGTDKAALAAIIKAKDARKAQLTEKVAA